MKVATKGDWQYVWSNLGLRRKVKGGEAGIEPDKLGRAEVARSEN